jgi:hypothetical protein
MRLGLLPPAQRPTLDETRPAPFRKADVDDIEVARNDRLRENRPCLAGNLGAEVAVRQVRQREHLHAGRTRQLGGAGRGRVQGLICPLLLLGGESRLVHEDVRLPSHVEHLRRRARIPGQDDLAPTPRRTQHLFGDDRTAAGHVNRLTCLQASEERPLGDAEGPGGLDVEAPRTRILGEAVAVRGDAVLDREGEDPVIAAVASFARAQLAQLDLVRQLSEDPPQDREEVDEAGRPVDGEGHLAPAEREGLQHPRQAEIMVGVVVRQEDVGELDEAHRRAEELALRALAAVEEDPVAAAADERPGEATSRRRHGPGGPEKDDVEVHGAKCRAAQDSSPGTRRYADAQALATG